MLLLLAGAAALLIVFWLVLRPRSLLAMLLISFFLSFALEPPVNRLARLGWRRGLGTAAVFAAIVVAVVLFVGALGSLLAAGAVGLSTTLVGLVLQGFTIGLFTFYLVADGPRLRRAVCSVLPPGHQEVALRVWDLSIDSTGGYVYSRVLLAACSAVATTVFLALVGVPYPLALDLWVLAFIVVYQQFENMLLSPRISARTMALHPAVAFGVVIAGGAIMGPIGALPALPAAACARALVSIHLHRYEVIADPLTGTPHPARRAL